MLHWYATEGVPRVVQRLIELGFKIDVTPSSGATPIQHAAMLRRWDMVRALRGAGARRSGVDSCGPSYRLKVAEAGDDVLVDLRGGTNQLKDFLLPGGPEDTPVHSLAVTQAGLPDDTPRLAISRNAWIDSATADPDIGLDLEDPLDLCAREADGAFAANLLSLDDQANVGGLGITRSRTAAQPHSDAGLGRRTGTPDCAPPTGSRSTSTRGSCEASRLGDTNRLLQHTVATPRTQTLRRSQIDRTAHPLFEPKP